MIDSDRKQKLLDELTAAVMLLHADTPDALEQAAEKVREAARLCHITMLDDLLMANQQQLQQRAAAEAFNAREQLMGMKAVTATEINVRRQQEEQRLRAMQSQLTPVAMKPGLLFDPKV